MLLNLLLLLHKVPHKADQGLHLVKGDGVVEGGPDASDRSVVAVRSEGGP